MKKNKTKLYLIRNKFIHFDVCLCLISIDLFELNLGDESDTLWVIVVNKHP